MTAWPSPRVGVFVSSTIGECAEERALARTAIESIKCDPILFETIGARPHPARVTYLEGLGRAAICVIIWKESYGWIDPAIGISGIEDEFRIAHERNLDLLVYIKADAPARDRRLKGLLDEARTFVTTHSYKDSAELRDQISADITSLLSQAFLNQSSRRAERLLDPAAILAGSIPLGMTTVERPALEGRVDASVQVNRRTWVVGAPGSGKTILLSQWATRHAASYVNARGLSLRHLLSAVTATLLKASSVPEALSLEEAADNLRAAWNVKARWPLVIDDPSDVAGLLRILDDLGDAEGSARVVLGIRDAAEPDDNNVVQVAGLSSAEAAEVISQLPSNVRAAFPQHFAHGDQILPLEIRKQAATQSAPQYLVFDDVEGVAPDPKVRELLAFIVASPEPLTLADLSGLTSSENAIQLDANLAALSFLLVDDGLGFRPVHDEIATDLRESLARRPALEKFVSLQLAQFFAKARRYLPAFELYREFDAKRALRMAYRAAAQASVEGRFAFALRPMEFIATERRKAGARLELATSLIALSQSYDLIGNKAGSAATIDEAEKIANTLDDPDLKQVVADQKLVKRVRRDLQPKDLMALAEVRQRYKADGRASESARLAIEEGAILIAVGQEKKAIPVLREARDDFLKLGDRYGVYIATRNLIASLNMQAGSQKEADELLSSLQNENRSDGGRMRERAWMCNILTRRYRIDGLLDDAVTFAREAIEIGSKIGDPYVVALNRIGLGNALREKGDLDAALEEFKRSGKEAQAINRTEIDGLASRLASSLLLEKVDHTAPYLHPELYNQAETFATYVIGLLSGSIAEMQAAQAYDCRGDARWGLGRKDEARYDWAAAARMFLQLEPDDALIQLNSLARNLDFKDRPIETMRVMIRTLPGVAEPETTDPWPMIITMIGEGIIRGHPRGAGVYTMVALKLIQLRFAAEYEVGLWLRILTLALENKSIPDDGRLAFVLSAFLAHTRQRNLSITQLTALTELTLGRSNAIRFHSVEDSLQTTFKLAPDDKILIVLNDLDNTPATRFAAAALTSFFIGFREDINREFLSVPLESGPYIRCSMVDVSEAPADIKEILKTDGSAAASISMVRRAEGGPHDIFVACQPDLQERCQGDMLRGTELQILFGDVLRAVLMVALGGDIESEMLRPKIVRLIRQTI